MFSIIFILFNYVYLVIKYLLLFLFFLIEQKVGAWCAKYVRVLKSITCWISNCSTLSRNCVPEIAFNCDSGLEIQSMVLMGIGLRGNRFSPSANTMWQFARTIKSYCKSSWVRRHSLSISSSCYAIS